MLWPDFIVNEMVNEHIAKIAFFSPNHDRLVHQNIVSFAKKSPLF